MTREEKAKAARLISVRANEIRGAILDRVSQIEKKTAAILVEYFCTNCPNKQELLLAEVFNAPSFGFRKKKDILVRILKQDYPRYWEREKAHFKAFDNVVDFRNQVAHCPVDLSEAALSRSLVDGIAFDDGNSSMPITDVDLNAFEVSANMFSSCLLDIEGLLPFKEVPVSPENPL